MVGGKSTPWAEIKKTLLLLATVLFAGSVWCYITTVPTVAPISMSSLSDIINKTIDKQIPSIAEKVVELLEQRGYVLLTKDEYNKMKKDLYILNVKVNLMENKISNFSIGRNNITKTAIILGNVYYLCDLAKHKEVATTYIDGKIMTCKLFGDDCYCGYKIAPNKTISFDYYIKTGKIVSYVVERLG